MSKTAVVIIGMHRSGTSALARCLSFVGWSLPRDLMPPQNDNLKGFWEPLSVVRLNNRILEDCDCRWDLIHLSDPNGHQFSESKQLGSQALENLYLQQAIEAITTSYDSNAQQIGVKDPRIGLSWRLWARALESVGYRVRPLIIVRNPLDVSASLKERNGFGLERATELWLQYNLTALASAHETLETIVRYNDLIENPVDACQSVLDSFNASNKKMTEAAAIKIEDFIDINTRHHVSNDEGLEATSNLPSLIRRPYAFLQNWNTIQPSVRTNVLEGLVHEFYQ